jgi:adenine-specific DNA-methyltransferase
MAKTSKKTSVKHIKLDSYAHKGAKRKNNPPVGLVSSATDYMNGMTKYQHDPHVDPYLSWAGKKEGTEIEVRNVSLHIHERIDAERIARGFLKRLEGDQENQQPSLFQLPDNEPPLAKDINFYGHNKDWANRLIAGDSLLVMNSLLNKEGMAGKVQMVYIDPPYGISYNSNFQPFTNKSQVKDREEEMPAEPEMIKAFRDTWELEVHSYLSHLRNRLLLAKEMLNDSGSIFVQISDENLHHVREIMDEIFGRSNFMSVISFRTKIPLGTKYLANTTDYIVWYAKNMTSIKFRKLYFKRLIGEGTLFTWVQLPNGENRRMTDEEKNNPSLLPTGAKPFRITDLVSAGRTESCVFPFEFEGRTFNPSGQKSWKTNPAGMQKLIEMGRIIAPAGVPGYMFFQEDYPVQEFSNQWVDTQGASDKVYVVQTSTTPIQRCMLMSTDPGDLVFDPTCGSGTTAFVAEQWGRRWITCDTSRVAVALAKQRLMTSKFDYYQLAHPEEGVRSGFSYKTVPHVTLGSIANNEPAKDETLYDQPKKVPNVVRVSGPFTVEAVPSVRVKPIVGKLPDIKIEGDSAARTGETGNQAMWRDELKVTGVRTIGGKKIEFSSISPMRGTKYLDAEGEILEGGNINKKAVISFGPDFGPIEQRQIEEAIKEARSLAKKPDFVIFAAFHFDPEASKDIDEINWEGVQLLKVQMSVDLLTHDLRKKKRQNQSYWLIGQPDVEVIKDGGAYKVKVNGFDYYNPISGEVESESSRKIAMWMIDTDYDERSLLPEQVFFPQGDKKRDWTKLAKALNGEVDQDAIEKFTGTESLPFFAGQYNKVAVKIVDDRGIESLVIKKLK